MTTTTARAQHTPARTPSEALERRGIWVNRSPDGRYMHLYVGHGLAVLNLSLAAQLAGLLAPDLLEACACAVNAIENACIARAPRANGGNGIATPEEQIVLEMLRAAIARAEGGADHD